MKRFCCPKCGNNVAEEVVVDATISNEVLGIEDEYDDLKYGDCGECFDGYTDRYQCKSCGYVLEGVTDMESMVEWLKKNGKESNT